MGHCPNLGPLFVYYESLYRGSLWFDYYESRILKDTTKTICVLCPSSTNFATVFSVAFGSINIFKYTLDLYP